MTTRRELYGEQNDLQAASVLGFIDDIKLSKTKNDLTKENETQGASYPDSTVQQTVKPSVILNVFQYHSNGFFSVYEGRKNLAPRIS